MAGSSSSSVVAPPIAPTVANHMPNQGRTLLLNISGAIQPTASFIGAEYVPPYFRPVTLTSGLLNVRRALFGSNADAAGMNYALWQYMRIVHSTEYAAYVTALDPRITYLTSESLVDYPYGGSYTPVDGALRFVGDPELGNADGKLMTSWNVSFAGSTVTIQNLQSTNEISTVTAITNGLTEFIPMVDHPGLKVQVNTVIGGSTWLVDYIGKPRADMDPINRAVQVSSVGVAAFEELFPRRDPYILFRKLWEQHTEFTYKLSGVLLAMMYRTNELRINGN